MPVPFTGLPQTLKVLPCFPALLWRHCGGLLRWEVRAVVTRWCRLGRGGRGWDNSRLRKREGFRKAAPLEERCGQHHRQQLISARKKRRRCDCWLRCNHGRLMAGVVLSATLLWEVGISESHMVLTGLTFLTSKNSVLSELGFLVYETMRSFTLSSSLNEQGNLYPPAATTVRHYSYPNVMRTQIVYIQLQRQLKKKKQKKNLKLLTSVY